MEQHPVPQNISSYEFRLVGDMTLKQFFQLAGGCIAGIIFFRLPIAGIFKYPFVFLSVLIGILSAFVPFQGRPFNQWLVAFFRAIYSSTEYVWSPTPIPVVAPVDTSTVNSVTSIRSQSQIFTGFSSFFASLLNSKSRSKTEPSVTPTSTPPSNPQVPASISQPSIVKEDNPPPAVTSPVPEPPQIIKSSAPTITTYSVASISSPKPEAKAAPLPPPIVPPIQPPTPNVVPSLSRDEVGSTTKGPAEPLKSTSFPGLPNIASPPLHPSSCRQSYTGYSNFHSYHSKYFGRTGHR